MSDTAIVIVIVLLCAGGAFALWWFRFRKEADFEVSSDSIQTTELGIRVAAKSPRSAEFLAEVDRAASKVFFDASREGYREWLDGARYVIYVKDDCTPSPVARIPSFKIRADNYDGTVFDQDPRPGIGYVFASEWVFKDNGTPTGEFVICADFGNLARNVRYGMEHVILYFNDPVRYAATETHTSGGHPLIPGAEEGLQ
ncbi:MAG TPA: hypothetical protein PKM58_00780 [Pyrinomonadaceae bacterium]|nr:hypothetical protein [Pyrinomonadaceae bacterium]HNU07136.1 hypothetical protein [Pyrinomonadaceae bacterium]